MSATKRPTEPRPTKAAIAFAASLALWIRAARSRSRRVTRSPGWRLIVDSPTDAVRRETVATSSSEACSSATIAVISFVIDAIGRCSLSSSAASTSPVPAFWTRYASASTGGGAAAAATAGISVAAVAMRRASRFTAAGTLLDADSLTDRESHRVDVRVEHEQLLDRGVVLLGDHGERVARLDLVELGSGLARRRDRRAGPRRRRCRRRRRGRRRRRRRLAVLEPGANQQDCDRGCGEEGGGRREPREPGVAPHHQ